VGRGSVEVEEVEIIEAETDTTSTATSHRYFTRTVSDRQAVDLAHKARMLIA
jgi:hypothetical protein